MSSGITVLWDKDTPFKQYLTDRGFDCEIVTPKILAAPFFSWRARKLLIVPAGFGNPFFSGVLKDLRATSALINKFVTAGGTLLVSGAFSSRDAYDWLPLKLKYVREEQTVKIKRVKENKAAAIVETDECMCDGYFEEVGEGLDVILAIKKDNDDKAILAVSKYGAGEILATTIHEYPSDRFIEYCVRR
jgi:hypothetical protein